MKRFFSLILLFAFVCLLCPTVAVRTVAAGTSASSGTGGFGREKPASDEPREEETTAAPEDETPAVTTNILLPVEKITEPISVFQTGTTVQTRIPVESNAWLLSSTPARTTAGTQTVTSPTIKDPSPTLPRIEIFVDHTPKAPSTWP